MPDPVRDRLEIECGFCKEHLMNTIEHLRREADYDYPPRVVRDRIRDVQVAERAYRTAWGKRAEHERSVACV